MTSLIEIKNCTLMRGETKALQSVSLSLNSGESLAVLGPNGSGKSSLLKLMTRELYPIVSEHASIKLMGQEHFTTQDFRDKTGLVCADLQASYNTDVLGLEVVISGFFDSNSLWHHFDITNEHIQKARSALRFLSIAALADTPYGNLSTGQQRRLLLARALVKEPEIVVFDEPCAGLDIQASLTYLDVIDKLAREQKSVILVTHDLNEIPPSISRVVLMQNGQILADGDKKDLFTDTQLSQLFGVSLKVEYASGYYQMRPKDYSTQTEHEVML